MIITDADHQDYAKDGGKFSAHGHVHLKTGDINVHSDKLQLVYGTDNKPEAAVFNGNVDAMQFENNTKSDMMTYYLSTQRLQATGNVKSRVIQKKEEPKKGGPAPALRTSDGELDPAAIGDVPDDDIILLDSDAQDYIKDTGRISAQGNVRLVYDDIKGWGPNVLVLRNDEGLVDKVIFRGRSEIDQPGKRWIGDRITLTCTDKKVLAEGNTRATIVQNPPKKSPALIVPGPDGQILAKQEEDAKKASQPTTLQSSQPAPKPASGQNSGTKSQLASQRTATPQ
jgi:lipopolysaccharide export system protein LptA